MDAPPTQESITTQRRRRQELDNDNWREGDYDDHFINVTDHWDDFFGPQLPLRIIFHPEFMFAYYDEDTVSGSMHMVSFVKHILQYPNLIDESRMHLLCKYLTVCTNKSVVDSLRPHVLRSMKRECFSLGWNDVRSMLINLGLTDKEYMFKEREYYNISRPRGSPHFWNFKFLLDVIRGGFSKWDVQWQLLMFRCLNDWLFEVGLVECHAELFCLVRDVGKVLLQSGIDSRDLMLIIDQYRPGGFSHMCNRHLVVTFSGEAALATVTKLLGFKTVEDILQVKEHEDHPSFVTVTKHLQTFLDTGKRLTAVDAFQITVVAHALVRDVVDDVDAQCFLKTLRHVVGVMHSSLVGPRWLTAMEQLHLDEVTCTLDLVVDKETVWSRSTANTGVSKGLSSKWCSNSQKFIMEMFCDDGTDIHCSPTCDTRQQMGVVVDNRILKFCEKLTLYSTNQYNSLLSLASIYTSQDIMFPACFISHLMKVVPDVACKLSVLMVNCFLQRHILYHPPCRVGMSEYYLKVFLSEGSSRGSLESNAFFLIIGQLLMIANSLRSMQIASDEGSGQQWKLHELMVLFNYFVDILVHDLHASRDNYRLPLIMKLVFCNPVLILPHCTSIIDLYVTCPRVWRHAVGRYLALLAGCCRSHAVEESDMVTKKSGGTPEHVPELLYFYPIKEFEVIVDTFLEKVIISSNAKRQITSTTLKLISDLPCNVLQNASNSEAHSPSTYQ